jgi:hypothetical protein
MWVIRHKNNKNGGVVNHYTDKDCLNKLVNRLEQEKRLDQFEVFELVPVSITDISVTVITKGII